MARGVGERPERSPAALLFEIDYPTTRDELAQVAGEAGAPIDVINFLKSLPDRTYESREDVQREFAEADARFGMFTAEIRHRGDIGKEAVETPDAPTQHP
jgi:Protein of unknown function (DUF2795)